LTGDLTEMDRWSLLTDRERGKEMQQRDSGRELNPRTYILHKAHVQETASERSLTNIQKQKQQTGTY